MDLRPLIEADFERRRVRNARYSLRAYARAMGMHHSTLSQLISGQRRLTAKNVRHLGARLGLSAEVVSAACLAEQADSLLRLLSRGDARFDTRWLSMRLGISIDDVNCALQQLLYERRLTIPALNVWTCKGAS